jgi:hypothetical protein
MPDRSKGRSQTKRDILVLQVGGWRETDIVKTKLFRNQIINLEQRDMEADYSGGQRSPRTVASRGRKDNYNYNISIL